MSWILASPGLQQTWYWWVDPFHSWDRNSTTCAISVMRNDRKYKCVFTFPKTTSAWQRLTHWGRVTHICVDKLTIIGSDNGLSPRWRQAIIWTNAGILLIGPLGTNFSEISIEIQTFSLKKIRLKMSSAKCCSFRLGLNVLTDGPPQGAKVYPREWHPNGDSKVPYFVPVCRDHFVYVPSQ